MNSSPGPDKPQSDNNHRAPATPNLKPTRFSMNDFYSQQLKQQALKQLTRRHLFQQCGIGVGAAALHSLTNQDQALASPALSTTHHEPKAKAVIFLFMAGGPSQLD